MPTLIKLRGKDVEMVGGWVSLWEHAQDETTKRFLREHKIQLYFQEGKPFKISCTDPPEGEIPMMDSSAVTAASIKIDDEHRMMEKSIRELTGVYVECRNWEPAEGPRESINYLNIGCPACLMIDDTSIYNSSWSHVEILWAELPECFCDPCRTLVNNTTYIRFDDEGRDIQEGELVTIIAHGNIFYILGTDTQYKVKWICNLDGDELDIYECKHPEQIPTWVQNSLSEWGDLRPHKEPQVATTP
jgi:hypothetical protein